MTISANDILRVRRMTNEPTEATYTDDIIIAMAEEHALTVSNWPNADTTVHDLHAIAAEIWEEKAAVLAQDFDFQADDASYNRSQAYEQFRKQAEYHFTHRKPRSRKPLKWPREAQVDVLL